MIKNNIYVVPDKVILEKLVVEGTLLKEKSKYGNYYDYVYPNTWGWCAVDPNDRVLLNYSKKFFDGAYLTQGVIDSDEGVERIIARSMTADKIIEHIRKISKEFSNTFTELKNRETMRALDVLS